MRHALRAYCKAGGLERTARRRCSVDQSPGAWSVRWSKTQPWPEACPTRGRGDGFCESHLGHHVRCLTHHSEGPWRYANQLVTRVFGFVKASVDFAGSLDLWSPIPLGPSTRGRCSRQVRCSPFRRRARRAGGLRASPGTHPSPGPLGAPNFSWGACCRPHATHSRFGASVDG